MDHVVDIRKLSHGLVEKIFSRGVNPVIISLVSTFIHGLVVGLAPPNVVAVILILILFIFYTIGVIVKGFYNHYWIETLDKVDVDIQIRREFIDGVVESITTLFIFIIVQTLLEVFRSTWSDLNLDTYEVVATLIVVILMVFSVYNKVKWLLSRTSE